MLATLGGCWVLVVLTHTDTVEVVTRPQELETLQVRRQMHTPVAVAGVRRC
jgi:hypothetical protein